MTERQDVRAGTAAYYDLANRSQDDVPFYEARAAGARSLLELGCGTGRVLVPLATSVQRAVGVDGSAAMLEVCRQKLDAAGLGGRVDLVEHDITDLHLGQRFDLVTAPFRVLQNLERNVEGFFTTIRRHLTPEGSAIVTAFRPNRRREALVEHWSSPHEAEEWRRADGDEEIRHLVRNGGLQRDPLTLYPVLIYRRYRGGELVDEASARVAMRVYYPDELVALVESAGLRVVNRWGGYHGEPYGDGPELVLELAA